MSLQFFRHIWIILFFIVLSLIMSRTVWAQQYVITDLGKLGGTTSQGVSITEDSIVYGWSDTGQLNPNGTPLRKPFTWQRGFKTEQSTLAAGKGAIAVSIAHDSSSNSFIFRRDYMTGDAETSTGATHAYLQKTGLFGGMTDLGTLPGTVESRGRAVNSTGQVAGWAAPAGGAAKAFFYSSSSGMVDISGGMQSAAYGINDAGQVTGYIYTGSNYHNFLYTRSTGQTQDLGTAPGYSHSYGLSINQSGQIVGYLSTLPFQQGSYRGFIYSGGTYQIIGNVNNSARDINNSGQVVGSYKTATGEDRGYIYQNGALTNLNTLIASTSGWVVKVAVGINDFGQIVGYGTVSGEDHAFLMTPIPVIYTLTDVNLNVGLFNSSNSLRINNQGKVVGENAAGNPAVWQLINGMGTVTQITNTQGHAYDINVLGEVVGESVGRAFYWNGTPSSPITDLGTLGGAGSVAFGITFGYPIPIVGKAPVAYDRAFYMNYTGGSMTAIDYPPGAPGVFFASSATAVNEFKQVVGAAMGQFANGSLFTQAFVSNESSSTIGLPGLGGGYTDAWDINNTGQAVGASQISFVQMGEHFEHACIWQKNSQGQWAITDLGQPQGVMFGHSKASAINNLGQIVGYSNIRFNGTFTYSSLNHAFIWFNGAMIDLNDKIPPTPGLLLIQAMDINDSGQIVCLGTLNGQQRIYLLSK